MMRRSATIREANSTEAHTAPSGEPAAPTDARPLALSQADHELIERIAARDVRALGLLYDRYGALIYTLALRLTESQEAAEALVGDVFAICWHTPSHLVANNVATALIAITCQQAHTKVGGAIARATSSVESEDRSQAPLWHHLAADSEEPVDMRAALAALPREQRECIELAYYDRLDLTAIAKRLQLSRQAVLQSLEQGLRTLKAHIDGVKRVPRSST